MLSLQSFAQSNFRGMKWGSTLSQLKSKYPDVQWKTETETKFKYYSTEDSVGGLEVTVIYVFIENKLQRGGYLFKEEHRSNNLYYEDFISISNILNDKYDMEINEKWNNTTWKGDSNKIGYALEMGYVEIKESYEDELTAIVHRISSVKYGGIEHVLIYSNVAYVKEVRASKLEDF